MGVTGQFHEVEIMADKTSPARLKLPDEARDQTAVSDDISRIVSYLNTKRSDASERTSDLVQELTHRREEAAGWPEGVAEHSVSTSPRTTTATLPQSRTNPLLAERYHSFCRDLDLLLDSFRARVEGEKQVRH